MTARLPSEITLTDTDGTEVTYKKEEAIAHLSPEDNAKVAKYVMKLGKVLSKYDAASSTLVVSPKRHKATLSTSSWTNPKIKEEFSV